MAEIVLGLATSHTPQLSTETSWWEDHANRDRRNTFLIGRDGEVHDYASLAAVPEWAVPAERLTPEVWQSLHERGQAGVQTLKDKLAEVAPDVVVVIGDDQDEMFHDDGLPTFAVFHGDSIYDMPPEQAKLDATADGIKAAMWARHAEAPDKYVTPGDLGRHLVLSVVEDEFDVVAFARQPQERSIGHAFTFVRRRLMGEEMIPLLPIAVNSYIPPNVPSARRCYQFGRAIRRAIESYPEDLRVAVVASGGLSHFVVDEELDRRILDGLKNRDVESLSTIPRKHMRSGTSESLLWIAAGGALEHLEMTEVDYIPAYRSEAGTGIGTAFAVWQ
ncbi:2,3-dihydroxyphenylpropionate/2,3-dihydroxicinnamic acid 1,2-dioxygenase [Streptomyces sp. RB5]|uniref:2,3-dihydroxyphenylpropionate/2, 3-dihydroxicinnamic acid 1,2-dioxygenase n=1 Tax=Streptomyces smaragdinus TaxID=2585196 RepID=A0A7K0CLF0_9ACTN|nr:protocatechuate 3,4-dioxygenase [Streptomyces smaragdinus]MQY14319.1 2,3-dihydroxyphenylpropionate/2,3-dihydroxicinnamic acid 1,2-dioxygenase [Streptomyces smaragdinus]